MPYLSKLELNGTTYDLKSSVDGSTLKTKVSQTGTGQSGITDTVAADTSMDNSIGILLNNDISLKNSLSSIKITGTVNNTGSRISKGTYFYLNDVLVKARTNIPNGDTLTLNTNYENLTSGGFNDLLEYLMLRMNYLIEQHSVTSEYSSDLYPVLYTNEPIKNNNGGRYLIIAISYNGSTAIYGVSANDSGYVKEVAKVGSVTFTCTFSSETNNLSLKADQQTSYHYTIIKV